MANSRLTLPADITDELGLRRLLAAIIREIDSITGVRGEDPYLKASQVPEIEVTTKSLNEAVNKLTENIKSVSESIDDSREAIEQLQSDLNSLSNVTSYDSASDLMLDLNDTSWSGLEGLYQITELGENILNPPFALTAGVMYNVYASNYATLGGGSVQEFIFENTVDGTISAYKRAGDSFSAAVSNGWLNV